MVPGAQATPQPHTAGRGPPCGGQYPSCLPNPTHLLRVLVLSFQKREFKRIGFSGGDLSRLGLLGWLKARWVRLRSYQPTHAIATSGVYPCKKIYLLKRNQQPKIDLTGSPSFPVRCIGVWQQKSGKGPRLANGAAYCVPDLTSHTPPPWRALLGRPDPLGVVTQPVVLRTISVCVLRCVLRTAY